MRAKIWAIAIIVIAGILLFSLGVKAQILIPAAEKGKENSKAAENSPNIGQTLEDGDLALNPPGLEKIVFIHYRKDFAKPPWAGGGEKENKSQCYDFLGRGVKWQELSVTYVINPDNEYGLPESVVTNAISLAAEEWDFWTGAELFGPYTIDYYANWDSDVPDGRNEISFGNYPKAGVIAVTVVWGYFSGPPGLREIVEFDILFDIDYDWGDASNNPSVMDLQNIATHELGHGVGLDDLYDLACAEETMYGYSDYGETDKRDLNGGDITGIQELYGP